MSRASDSAEINSTAALVTAQSRSFRAMTSSTIRAMRSQQELEHLLDQYDLKHAKRGGLAGAVLELAKKAGFDVMSAPKVVNRLFPDLPDEDRRGLIDILNRDLVGEGRGRLRVLVEGGDIPLRLRLAKKSVWQMQGRKLFEVEDGPRPVLFELCDGFYWDGEPAIRNSDGTPALDGFYVGLLGDDWRLIRGFDGGDILYGPYAALALSLSSDQAARRSPGYATSPSEIGLPSDHA